MAVQGSVRNAAGQPIADVSIELVDSGGITQASAVSDADGLYSLAVEQGTYDVVVTPPEESIFSPQTFPDKVIDVDTTLDVVLVPTSNVNVVSGRVTDDDGVGVERQNVCLRDEETRNTTCGATDENGNYALAVAADEYRLLIYGEFREEGDEGGSEPPGAGGAGGAPNEGDPGSEPVEPFGSFQIEENGTRTIGSDTIIDVTLPTRTVSGEVRDADGQAVSDAHIDGSFNLAFDNFTGYLSLFEFGPGTLETDENGQFELPALPGTGTLNATVLGLPSGSAMVTVADTDVTGVVIELPPVLQVSGRVVDDDGVGVEGQNVCLREQDTFNNTCGGTDEAGNYALAVAAGEYRLSISGQFFREEGGEGGSEPPGAGGAGGAPSEGDPGSEPVEPFGDFWIEEAGTRTIGSDTIIGVTLPVRKVSGEVRDADGQAVSAARVDGFFDVVFDNFIGNVSIFEYGPGTLETDENGQFELPALPGTGTVRATVLGLPSGSAMVTVADTDVTDVVIELPPVLQVSGQVVDDEGVGVEGQNVCLREQDTFNNTCGGTDEAGNYVLAVAADEYRLLIYGEFREEGDEGGSEPPGAGGAGGAPNEGDPGSEPVEPFGSFQIEENGTRTIGSDTIIDVTLPTRTVSGEVRDADGQAVSDARIDGSFNLAFDNFTGYLSLFEFGPGTLETDENGQFELPALPGVGTLQVEPDPDSGLTPFSIQGLSIVGDLTLVVSVQFLMDSAANPETPPDGTVTTDEEGDGATPADPIETSVTTPDGGEVIITEAPITEEEPDGFNFLTQQVNITAPPAAVTDPLVLVFKIDSTRLPAGVDETNLEIFKGGDLVQACDAPPDAVPDPCVLDRARVGDDVVITVLTTTTSPWNVGYALPSDRDGDGTLDGYDGCPDDAYKTEPGVCDCGVSDDDSDGDGTADCHDGCDDDPDKLAPGECGCGFADEDSDGDGALDCNDPCPNDPSEGCLETGDADADGVDDAADNCADTPAGEVVNEEGCSIAQLCPCQGPQGSSGEWRNHGSYVACVSQAATAFRRAGLIDGSEAGAVVSDAARSDCGQQRPPRSRSPKAPRRR